MKGILKFPNAIYKIVRPGKKLAPNEVLFHVPIWHNKVQIKNYLEELYNVEIERVDTTVMLGKTKSVQTKRMRTKFMIKKPDVKKAYVTLKNQTFSYPSLDR
eukprot:CAMPEP_0184481646 /NCGR_PEP_ID=MMETSP0113_2-20130426/3201_1 /TAXON_ID=91329 /ORGANISM="Norrisiella sphaerica, Strain BC52" /LENGTH=101 /DNA_ID=CAMNT_0026860887 /DNA_START=20 /DNA_END=325 /DNA_ORIENTATION=-